MSFEKKCKFCGRTFYSSRYTSSFCSTGCYYKFKRTESNKKRLDELRILHPEEKAYLKDGIIYYKKRCTICGRKFESTHIGAKYCSERCHSIGSRRLMDKREQEIVTAPSKMYPKKPPTKVKECEYCGKSFLAVRGNARFCSNGCYLKYRKEESLKKRLEEVRNKYPEYDAYIRDNFIWLHKKCELCGRSFETIDSKRRFCSETCEKTYRLQMKHRQKIRERQLREIKAPGTEQMKGRPFAITKVCEWCGMKFVAYKKNTRFCSSACARNYKRKEQHEQRERRLLVEAETPGTSQVKEFMRISEAASYLSLGRTTLYRLLRDGSIRYVHNGGISLISREAILDFIKREQRAGISQRHPDRKKVYLQNPVLYSSEDYMSIVDAADYFDIDLMTMRNMMHKSTLPFERIGNVKYYLKKDVERLVNAKRKAQHPEITEWYSVEDIMEKFGMTRKAVYQFVNARKGIPSKKIGKLAYYSKSHVDRTCQKKDLDMNLYYTAVQAAEHAGVSLERLYKLLRRFEIPKINIRGKIFVSRKEWDELIAQNTLVGN